MLIKIDPLVKKERNAMKKLIVDNKARFKYRTISILKSIFCLRIALPRPCLRRNKSLRYDLYYQLGIEHIDKELDIKNILKKIRMLNAFMKMILDTD